MHSKRKCGAKERGELVPKRIPKATADLDEFSEV